MKGANIQKTGSGMKLFLSFKAGWNSPNHSHTVARGSRRKSGGKTGQIHLNHNQTLTLDPKSICQAGSAISSHPLRPY
jgi:hypothetical protein